MAIAIKDIILDHIDQAFDTDDLENIGDFVRSVITVETIDEWQLAESLRQLHTDLQAEMQEEAVKLRQLKLRVALSHFEADFSDYLIAKETESLPLRNGRG